MNLFQLGDFTLNSGAKSVWKIDCDALSDGDIAALARMVQILVGPFHSVEGIPRGGLRLAESSLAFRGIRRLSSRRGRRPDNWRKSGASPEGCD